eukprot:CAMPEP_0168628946 /NCGR_PEP_ID=MMETSP0449_2-20121227/12120_1 /TAXON_ID=1082188 /ORGANISM="Strombidium rassoulzadegani, Strain ras09" /LENGTH=54 /DNA_ID=CAMNT_0008671409 /DNA_START=801 /DNA_END=962 /DNA_ORIENTATION=+
MARVEADFAPLHESGLLEEVEALIEVVCVLDPEAEVDELPKGLGVGLRLLEQPV